MFTVADWGHPERLAEALALSSSFHVLDIGMVDAWLGYSLIMAWTAHADYPPEAMTITLAELVTRVQANVADSEATNALGEQQKAILRGLPWDKACVLFIKAYLLCVTARRDISKEEIVELLNGLPPGVSPALRPPRGQ